MCCLFLLQIIILLAYSANMKLDPVDKRILAALQTDGRITNQALAEIVGLSPSPCLRRVRLLEEAGAISGYTAQIDRKICGLNVTAFVRIRLKEHSRAAVDTFERHIATIDEIVECHLTSGEEDYLLQVVVESQEAYEHFMRVRLHSVPGIGAVETNFAFGVVKPLSPAPMVLSD